jgi:NhaP-type Na+/H+ and K+/H+ antiporter
VWGYKWAWGRPREGEAIDIGAILRLAPGLLGLPGSTAVVMAPLLASRLRVPALLLFLGLRMAVGWDGLDWIDCGRHHADYDLTLLIGTIALASILFEAGYAAGVDAIRPSADLSQ